jgi:hypothetical protein
MVSALQAATAYEQLLSEHFICDTQSDHPNEGSGVRRVRDLVASILKPILAGDPTDPPAEVDI